MMGHVTDMLAGVRYSVDMNALEVGGWAKALGAKSFGT